MVPLLPEGLATGGLAPGGVYALHKIFFREEGGGGGGGKDTYACAVVCDPTSSGSGVAPAVGVPKVCYVVC